MLLLQEQEAGETTETIDGTLLVQTVRETLKGFYKPRRHAEHRQ